jgi:hypothetical protein
MRDHVSLGITNIDRSQYDALRPLGLVGIVDFGENRMAGSLDRSVSNSPSRVKPR